MCKMKYNFYAIGDRLTQLRKDHGYKTQDALIEKLKEMGVPIGRNTYSKIENGLHEQNQFSLGLLSALAELYNCDVGYLLCEYDCKTGRNTDIAKETGLTDRSIQAIDTIKHQSMNDNSERPKLLDLLNLMLSYGGMERILMSFRDFVNPCYNIPVYFDNEKKTFVCPNNEYSKLQGISMGKEKINDMYWLNFAQSEQDPDNNIPLLLNSTFFETVALKDIEKELYTLRELFNEK